MLKLSDVQHCHWIYQYFFFVNELILFYLYQRQTTYQDVFIMRQFVLDLTSYGFWRLIFLKDTSDPTIKIILHYI